MKGGTILVVDDEPSQRDILRAILEAEGYDVEDAGNGEDALRIWRTSPADVLLSDLKLPGMDGLTLLKEISASTHPPCVIIMTAYGTVDSAVQAMKAGAFDYLTKPLEKDEVILTLQRAFERIKLLKEKQYLQEQLEDRFSIENIIGTHGSIQECMKIVRKVAGSSSTVLILGESGTGKELFARAIHYASPRRAMPFYAVNCASIPETLMESEIFGYEKGAFTGAISRKIGLLEAADKGTLFLDEIGDLTAQVQATILRVLQEKEFMRVGGRENIRINVRIIAASNKDLKGEIAKRRFREDLFYRLNVVSFVLTPLRDRATDIPLLTSHFIKKYSLKHEKNVKDIQGKALNKLIGYRWPGNVRELEAAIERAILLTEKETISLEDLPQEIREQPYQIGKFDFDIPPEGFSFEEFERDLLLKAVRKSQGVISQAARLLGMSYRTLQYRLKKFGIIKTPSS